MGKKSKVMLTVPFSRKGGIKGVAVKDRPGFKFQNVNIMAIKRVQG